MKPQGRGPLPLMKSLDDAKAICRKEKDNFFVTAFLLEAWLGDVTYRTEEEYAEKKSAVERRLQTGMAWKSFMELFGHCKDDDVPHLFGALLRFAEYEDVQSEMLYRGFWALGLECPAEELFSGQFPSGVPTVKELAAMMRRRVERLCDWVEAITHFHTHVHYHLSPVSFDTDPEKRELAALGINQRCFSILSESSKQWWQWHHAEAAERFKGSRKWPTVGKAMAATEMRQQRYPQVDELVILLWPLLKRNHWTYCDMMNVVNRFASRPGAYPCEREQDFATYCNNVLGLRKGGLGGKTAKNGRPAGMEVVERMCQKLPHRDLS